MEASKNCGCFSTCMIFMFVSLVKVTTSEVYTVGDNDQWDNAVDYGTWSQKYNFKISDILVFNYIKGQHDACEVTETTYHSCNASAGVLAKYTSGDDQVTLTEARKYWFICSVDGHCLGGMRFGIIVNEANTTTNSTSSSSLTPQPPALSPSNKSGGYGAARCCMWRLLMWYGVLFHLYSLR